MPRAARAARARQEGGQAGAAWRVAAARPVALSAGPGPVRVRLLGRFAALRDSADGRREKYLRHALPGAAAALLRQRVPGRGPDPGVSRRCRDADAPPPVPDVPLEWGDGLGPRGEPAAAQPECSRSADRMVSHPAGRDGRIIPSHVPAHDGARRIDRRAPSAWEERSGLMNQAARSARSVAGAGRAFSPADTSARGRDCGARAERIMASDAHTSSSLTYRRVRIARRRAVIAHPGRRRRGRRVAVIAISSFVLRGSLDVWFCLRDGPPVWGSDLPLPLESS
jgi:hypothetical protein